MDSDTSTSPSLHLGLLKKLPTEALAGWGCVTPFWGGKMADPFSAEQATFVVQPEDLVALKQWLTTVGLTKLERQLRVLGIERGSTEVAEVMSRQFVLQGSPKGSQDSLFLTAWKGSRSQRKFAFSSRLSSSDESK
ncbi:MAG: hypothetical protein P8O70_09735 [SAR324 cluster bacterium]|nr:hypothetical protein [SAR324 cluster bacterium]